MNANKRKYSLVLPHRALGHTVRGYFSMNLCFSLYASGYVCQIVDLTTQYLLLEIQGSKVIVQGLSATNQFH